MKAVGAFQQPTGSRQRISEPAGLFAGPFASISGATSTLQLRLDTGDPLPGRFQNPRTAVQGIG
jgi:hypothetical protein